MHDGQAALLVMLVRRGGLVDLQTGAAKQACSAIGLFSQASVYGLAVSAMGFFSHPCPRKWRCHAALIFFLSRASGSAA